MDSEEFERRLRSVVSEHEQRLEQTLSKAVSTKLRELDTKVALEETRFTRESSDRQAADRMTEFLKQADEIESRVIGIERRVRGAAHATATGQHEGEAETAEAGTAPPPEPVLTPASHGDHAIDLNNASFNDFRRLGLSVTQSARLVARREARGRFTSLDDLDELWGFPRHLVEELKTRVRV
jgi:DNA uptake protein ComE-like DNA-binding protein